MEPEFIDAAQFRSVLGAYPTGVCAITAMAPAGPTGMVVGSFTSVSLDPPLVGFLPAKSSTTWALIEAAGHFCVNVLARDQMALCRQLAAKGEDKFAGIAYRVSSHGLPVINDALAIIECQIAGVQDAGDHWFVLGRVLTLDAPREADPMIFLRGQYGGFAE